MNAINAIHHTFSSHRRIAVASAAAAVVASLALTACNKPVDQTATSAANSPSAAMDSASASIKSAAKDVGDATKSMAADARDSVADGMITTTVKAELAKDSQLSALDINVDTSAGHVALKGTAPDDASKERATKLASAVKGVTSVDNQLVIEQKKS